QASGIGLIIMVAGGFASYMNQIGASDALVRICTAPLKVVRSPYIVLSLAYMLGQALFIVIPSAAGLAMLLLVLVYPILIGLGVSRA
ncbi:transporter, partial [Escherichia coli]|nr:transporter [Escherichia coli]